MIDELTLYNLEVKYHNLKDIANAIEEMVRAEVIDEFVNWLGKELATIHLFPEQRAKLYADILIKSKELKENK